MRILREHLLLCTLFALLSGNVADRSPPYDGIFTQNQDVSQDDDSNYRLPTNIKPTSYDLKLIPNLEDSTFTGYAKIEAVVESTINNITLHVGNLNIESVHVSAYASEAGPSDSYDSITEKYTIFLTKPYEKGKQLEISITYNGTISDNMIGLYRSSYFDENGQIKWLLATQFETTHARHVFPCFDEPSFKANFTIRIARGDNYKSLSNMPLEKAERLIPGAKTWDIFYPSIPMSTYLVAFVVSEFDSLGDGKVKVWSRPSTANQRDYALKIGTAALDLFETKFNQNYTLSKMDMVAVPDFAAGAMENWGLVTYRESRVLYDEKESSVTAQQSVAATIVHELTHMWFGNLVTPEWWSYLWLSEGFATYFQYFGTAELEPTWNMEKQFVVEQHQSALIADGLESSLPMSRVVSTSSESQIARIGDTITYNKGASIIRMMSHTFGAEIFNQSLNSYLENNKENGLANPDALWKAIQDQIENEPNYPNIDVKAKMDTWTKQAGYPVVTFSVNDNGILSVSQERFFLRNLENTSTDTIWAVPFTFTTESKPNFSDTIPKYWISAKNDTIDYGIDPKKWVIFNVQSSGFYRVNYNNRGWQNIFIVLKSDQFNVIHELNRAGIVDDLLNLGRAGYLNYDLVLSGLLYLQKETNYLPFKAAFNGLEYLHKRFTGHAELAIFKIYVQSLIENIHVKLGYEELEADDRFAILLRREVNNWLCNFDIDECVTIYREKFKQWTADANARIKPNDRPTAYCVAIKHGTSEDWEFLWKEYLASNNAADQTVILNALGCSQNTTILETYLKNAITNYQTSRIRKHDSTSVFAAVYNSGLLSAEYILDFVDKYHKEMEDYYGEQSTIATILDGASQHLSTPESVDKFEKFILNHTSDFESIQKSLNYSLTVAKYELELYQSFSTPLTKWLEEYDKLSYRLPMDIIPKNYTISLTPYLDDFHVDGKVSIEADVKQPTSRIILHSSNITIHDVKVTANQKNVTIFDQKLRDRYDFLVIYLATKLTAGTKLTVEIEYTGYLNATELRGFYKSSYVNEKRETRWLAASHLEPVGARKMFPCFDEPALRATFTIQVNVLPDYQPISNMGWQAIEKIGNRTSYTFFESEPMSTYLVAVIVSDFKCKSIIEDQIQIDVYARPNAIDQTDYALSIISPLVKFFETTYNQSYKLPKLSMAALPDFPSGAMENWGLLTYRETNMLYDENHSPITNKQDIRNVIAHEISHQWFGNLVTPMWWTYLWLNEGFARYFEYYAPARVFRDTTMDPQFVVDQVHSAFRADSFKSIHPLSHAVTSPREILSIFDTITYAKGGSILRMIEKTYGTDVFDSALSDYLNKRQYNVTEPKDLYASLQPKIAEKGLEDNIGDILDTWTTQPGYPVIYVDVAKYDITISQKRFFLKQHEATSDNTMWQVPITWTSVQNSTKDSDTTPKLWLTRPSRRVKRASDSLLIFNTQQSGYYRVNYNERYWLKLIDYLKNQDFETIHEINRAAIIDDLMNLARGEYIDYKILISATMYLEKENNYFPWRAFFNNLPYLNNRFAGRDIEGLYKKWLTPLIEQLYTRLSFEDNATDDDLTKMLRIHARKWACKLDIADCKFNAAKYFQQKQHSKPIPPNYRDAVYCTAMRMDKTINSYKFLWNEYLNSTVTTDKLVILNSLACSENKDVLEMLLKNATITENSPIRYQDSAKVFSSVYDASSIGVEVVMKVIETSYDGILHRNFDDYTKIAEIVSALANRLSTNDLFNQYQKLLDWLVNREPEFKKSVDSYLATAKYEFDWYERNVPVIFETLDKLFLSNINRLPKTLDPKLYNVYLTPNMKEGNFTGKVEIHMRVQEDTTLIALNSHKLNILNVKVVRKGIEIKPLNIRNITKHIPQQFRIYLSEYVYTNEEIVAEIEFKGTLTDNMNGFYRSSYDDINGVQHWLATTQFEPTYARQAFPCFDEPAFKSKFTINIRKQENYKSLSNMPRKPKGNNSESDVWDTFYTSSVDMSTYLVAFVVSEFHPALEPENVTINVWGRPEVAKYGKYAQNISAQLIDELQNITGINYTLPKLDLVGIPDFSNGAMENWGLATFREYGLFYDEKETTATSEKNMISIIAHELTHMWFGNLVTCDWWDYIWLNEGFAQYFEWVTADRIRPEYKFMDQFVVYELQPALAKDASLSAHPMTNPVNTPEEIAGIFDYVTYGKAASVLRMMFNVFKNDTDISSALHDYLTKRMYLTARPKHLWESFQPYVSIPIDDKNENRNIEEIMNTWTDQPGYPIVHASLYGTEIVLTQKRFLDSNPPGKEFYWIPVDVFVASDVFVKDGVSDEHQNISRVWLGPEAKNITINSNNDWFIVNYKQTGFYRVNYDASSWSAIINKLNNTGFENIHVINRAQIIDDLFNLAHANYVSYELLLDATVYLKRETNHLPWKAFFNGLSYVHGRFEEQQTLQQNLNGYILNLVSGIYDKIGFDEREDEQYLDKLNRELVLQWACKLDKKECIDTSVNLFKAWRDDSTKRIPPNARPAVYCTAIKKGNAEDWDFLWNQYLQTNFATEKKIIINALGCSTDAAILENYLAKAIEKSDPGKAAIRRQDVSAVFASVYSAGSIGLNVTFNYSSTHILALYKYYENWKDIADLFVNIASYMSSEDQCNQLVFFVEHYINLFSPVDRLRLRTAITTVKANLLWFENNSPIIRDWIMKQQGNTEKDNSSTRIESLSIVLTALIALISYLLSH